MEGILKMIIEKELKYLISEDDFLKLRHFFTNCSFTKKNKINENFYFESKNFRLEDIGLSIRLRKNGLDIYELTIKDTVENSIENLQIKEEHTMTLTHEQVVEIFTMNSISIYWKVFSELKNIENIIKKLEDNKINELILLDSSLLTKREIYESHNYKNLVFFLDENKYLSLIDYELEIEIYDENLEKNIEIVNSLLLELNIKSNKSSISKSKRFKNTFVDLM
ncbi:MAG: CYTH domain-containing protein [Paraclostridium sp.]